MKQLSNSELLILQIFWKYQCKIPKKNIYKMIQNEYPDKWTRSSISVFLIRLEEKSVIYHKFIKGVAYICSIKKSEYALRQLNLVLQQNYSSASEALLGFVDEDKRIQAIEEIESVLKKYNAQ